MASLEELKAQAFEAAESGQLEDILAGFQVSIANLASDATLYTDGRSGGTSIVTPAHLSRYVVPEEGEYILRLDRAVLGSALPVGTCLIARRGARAAEGMLAVRWEGEGDRSEEHTSELQSLMRISYAVFCWKKKKQKTTKFLM